MISQQEKAAWYQLVVIAVALATCLALWPFLGLERAMAGLGIMGLIGFSPILFRRNKSGSPVLWDERDRLIQRAASFNAFNAFWCLFFVGYLCLWWRFRGVECIPSKLILSTPFVGLTVFYLVQSASTVVQYRRGA